MTDFPGSEDYDEGCDPVRELTLMEQIAYWKARARLFEELAYSNSPQDESAVADLERVTEIDDDDPGDWWKRET